MASGVFIKDSQRIRFENCTVSGVDVGFKIDNSDDVEISNIHCEGRTVISGSRARGLIARNIWHNDRSWNSLSLIAIGVREANGSRGMS